MSKKFSFQTSYQQAEKQYNLGRGEYYKLQEGDNKIRLVSECLPHESEYKGKMTFKWLSQVIDRKDGKIKPFFMPITIYKQIEALQLSDDYAFEEVPMPYDITIRAIGAGTKEVKYSTIAARKNTPVTEEEYTAISEAPTVQELQDKIRESENKKEKPAEVKDDEDIDMSQIPF